MDRSQDEGMTTGSGAPPKTGWAKLVPELLVSDFVASIEFWRDRLGFALAYQRPEEAFAYLERPEGAQIMLRQRDGKWETAPLDRPYGRGAMLQVNVDSIEPIQRSLEAAGWPLYAGPREVWREVGGRQVGQSEIFVLDPDGYLVMVAHDLGERPLLNELVVRPVHGEEIADASGATRPHKSALPSDGEQVMFTCFIRYYVDPDKLSELKEYARAWISLIQKYGGIHHGYFIPGTEADNMPSAAFSFPGLGTEGPPNVAVALFSFPGKEAYEQYRVSVANDDLCKAATARFEETKCVSSYERTFLIPIF